VFSRSLFAFGLASGLSLTRPSSAAGTTPVRITIEAPDGCSSPRAFFDAVRARTDRIHLTARREGLELRVSVTRAHNKVRGELRVIDENGGSSARTVEGASCAEVVHALSLTAALVLDQIVPPVEAMNDSTAAPGENGGAFGSERPSQGARRGEGESPSEVRQRGDDEEEEEDAEELDEPEPSEEDEDEDDDIESSEPSEPFGVRVEVGAQSVVGEIISPRVSVGGALFVSANSTWERVFSPSVGLAIAHVPAEFGQAGGDVSVRWTAALLSACPLTFRPADSLAIRPCALGIGGQVVARGESSDVSAKASRSWWSTGVLGRATLAIGSSATLRFELGLTVPLARRRFVTTPPEKTVGESPTISAIGGLGVAHVF
jgi:hypothetical protein